jgi:hypothetical protein
MFKVLTATHEKKDKSKIFTNFMEGIMKAPKLNNTTNEVLFQKLGNTWFVFTEVKGNMIYSALPEDIDPRTTKLEFFDVIEEHMEKVSRHHARKPEIAA